MRRLLQAAILLAALSGFTSAHAVPIVYTLTGTASGELAGVSFTNAAFSITGTGDSGALETPEMDAVVMPLQSLFVELAGFGQVDALNPTYRFVNRNVALAGFLDLFAGDVIDLSGAGFSGYDGVSDLGPLAVTSAYVGQFDTSGGTLLFTDAGSLLFEVDVQKAAQVPEPGGIFLLAVGLAAFAVGRRAVRHAVRPR